MLFYLFAGVLTLSALGVVSAKNPVHSVFFLIFSFFNAAALFVLIGAEYIAMTLVIVYVGAVAVLFLFVVMMLNINFAALREGFMRNLPFGIGIAMLLFIELFALLYSAVLDPEPVAPSVTPVLSNVTNTSAIGNVLYTHYSYLFQIAGLILLVAMIGSIVLTLRAREGVRRQSISKQHNRTREESIVLVKMKPGEGIS